MLIHSEPSSTHNNSVFIKAGGEHLVANQLILSIKNEVLTEFPGLLQSYPNEFSIYVLLFDSKNFTFSYRGTMYQFINEALIAFKEKDNEKWASIFSGLEEITLKDLSDTILSFDFSNSNDIEFWYNFKNIEIFDAKRLTKDAKFIIMNLKNLNILLKYYSDLKEQIIQNKNGENYKNINTIDLFHFDYLRILYQLRQKKNEGLSMYCFNFWKHSAYSKNAINNTKAFYFADRIKKEQNPNVLFKVMAYAERLIGVGSNFGHILVPIICYGQLKGEVFFVDRQNFFKDESETKIRKFKNKISNYLDKVDIAAAIGDIWQSRLLTKQDSSNPFGDYSYLIECITFLAAVDEISFFSFVKSDFSLDKKYVLEEIDRNTKFVVRREEGRITNDISNDIKINGVKKKLNHNNVWYIYFPNGEEKIIELQFIKKNISDADVRYFYLKFLNFGIQLRHSQAESLEYDLSEKQKKIRLLEGIRRVSRIYIHSFGSIAKRVGDVSSLLGKNNLLEEQLKNPINDLDSVVKDLTNIKNNLLNKFQDLKIDGVANSEKLLKELIYFRSKNKTRPTFAEKIQLNKIHVTVRIKSNPNLIIDEGILREIYRTILENAINATTEIKGRRKILIMQYLDKSTNKIIISIYDNGIGMNEECKNKILKTEGFSNWKLHRGHGIGLYTCNVLLEMFHGWIDININPGNKMKTMVWIELPVLKNG